MKQKRILTILLTLMMILTVLPGNVVFAETASNIFDGGTGTQEDPYRIKTLEQLEAFRDSVNGGGNYTYNDYGFEYIKLTADIDMSAKYGADIDGNEISWTPIGEYSEDTQKWKFFGTFDGDGHIIKNLYINAEDSDYQGLFGYVGSIAVIQNLGVSGNVTGRDCVGGIAALNEGTISNCYNTAVIVGNGENGLVGGVVGANIETLSTCYNTGTVTGSGIYVGGIAGNDIGTIQNSYNTGTVNGADYVGGVAGIASSVKYCYNIGTVAGSGDNTGEVIGGKFEDSNTMTDCYYLSDTASEEKTECTAITSEQFKMQETFENWDFTNVWEINGTLGHRPTLKSNFEGYIISTLEQLEAFRDSVNGGNDYKNKIIRLTADIDMSTEYGADINGNEVSWTPIGNKSKKFKGTFDGDGHIIENLYINAKESDYQALFGYMDSGTITNLGVSGNVTGQAYVGGIVGYVYSYSGTAVISNCYNNATVNGTYRIGGVVGYIDISYGAITISNCRNTGSINGTGGYVGGVAGGLNLYKSTAMISDCSNSGTITGSGNYVGGISGYLYMSGNSTMTISNCSNSGTIIGYGNNVGGISGYASPSSGNCILTISNCYNTAAIEGIESVGGVIGDMNISGTTTISNCYNTGAVNSKEYAGGVIGYPYVSSNSKFELSDSYNLGKVSSTDGYSGGVVGFARLVANSDYETLTISNCRNEGEVISQNADIVGGVVAYASAYHGTTTISNCYNTGTVSANDKYVGGVVGYASSTYNGTTILSDCYNTGAVSTNDKYVGGVVGYTSSSYNGTTTISNCYYLTDCAKDGNATVQYGIGNKNKGSTTADIENQTTAKTTEQLSSGEVTWLLNRKTADGVWKQTLGTDSLPNFTGKTLYYGYAFCADTEVCYSNDYRRPTQHDYVNGVCTATENEIHYETPVKNETTDFYEIGNLGQLMWFAQKINAQEINAHKAILTADITIDNSVVWVPIALKDHCGSTFDGDGHTITFANTNAGSNFGLFASYNYSTIKNLYLAGSITCNSGDYSAVLVNRAYSTLLENVISTCSITNSGGGATGGLTGYFGGGSAAIKNCAVYADVSGAGHAGGLIGNIWNGNQPVSSVSNCAYMGNVTGGASAGVGALVGYNGNNKNKKSPFTNVYFCESDGLGYLGKTNGGTITLYKVEEKTAKQFEDGVITYLLNNAVTDGTQVWYQTLGTDKYPKFTGDTVYYGYIDCYTAEPIYTNTPTSATQLTHDYINGICRYCGDYQAAVHNETDGVYEISNAGQFMWFANLVNTETDGVYPNRTANAVLKDNIDMSVISDYIPIGTTGLYYSEQDDSNRGYQGIFDGNGYAVKNLSVAGSDTAELTYGVFGTLSGTVKNLGVENFAFTVNGTDCRVGGIAGQILNNGLVKNCYVINSAITATSRVAGGIAGCNYSGTIANSFTYKVSITASRFGGIVGDNRGDNGNDDRKGTITSCYTDASAIESSKDGNVQSSDKNVSDTDFASGKITWLLNGSGTDGVWKQTLGENGDSLPKFTGGTVYRTSPCVSYSNTEPEGEKPHNYKNGICENYGCYEPAVLNETDNIYEISNLGQLLWFADTVNGGKTSVNGKLMKNIDATDAEYIGIGTDANSYSGIFDGNGFKITLNLKKKTQYLAPFLSVSGATIKNLTTDGNIATSEKFAAGILGIAKDGNVTLENCVSYVVIESTVSGDGTHGGLVANASNGTLTINNCGFAGAINGAKTDSCGGFVGWANTNVYINNSYVSATFGVGVKNGNTFSRNPGKAELNDNCYYLSAMNETPTAAIQKSEEAFANGEVAYLLQGTQENNVWGQKIGTDKYPTICGAKVYEDEYDDIKIYRNDIDGFEIFKVGADSKSAVVLLENSGTYTIIFADYEENKLVNTEAFTVTVTKAQAVRVISEKITLGTGDKIMLWSDSQTITPLCNAYEIK